MFQGFSQANLNDMSTSRLFDHNHEWSIPVENFYKQEKLAKFMRITATATADDKNNTEFVDTMEAYNYPIMAAMYHPEKQLTGAGSVPETRK